MPSLNVHKTGLIFGSFAAIMHAVWSLVVALGLGQAWLNFVFGMHFIKNPYMVNAFSFGTALGLIIMAFIVAYVIGFVFAMVWNRLHK